MEPVNIPLRDGDTFYSIKPPGSGVLLGFILSILNNYNFTASSLENDDSTILTYHRIVEALKYAYAKRTELADMDFVNISSVSIHLETIRVIFSFDLHIDIILLAVSKIILFFVVDE